ncbi:uncharacterized protein LOC111089691, partial [Limulus polyphemus]|uniref:Uncharacterized protein LOC111089691 n=1 Tax=Limulus polyphemus TaxID=6850 RepID=A0ABM1TR26_LIMPO
MSNTDYETSSRQTSQQYINKTDEDDCHQYRNLPPELYETMKNDKKPFTYTPGGINLLEIKSPRMAKRIIANQQDPGVAVRPKTQKGPSAAVIQAEIHASENLVYSQPVVTRQPVLPGIINNEIYAPGNRVYSQAVATRQPVLPGIINNEICAPGNRVYSQAVASRQPVLPGIINNEIYAPGNRVYSQPVATRQPVLPGIINNEIYAPGNRVYSQAVGTRQPVLPGVINQHSILLSPKVTQRRNVDLYSSENAEGFYLAKNGKDPNHDIYYEPRGVAQPCFLCVAQKLTSTEKTEDKN